MKKLLFFGYTLEMGGAEKVLIDFLKVLKPDYEIDLVLLQAKGELLQNLPEGIQVQQIRNNPFSYFLFRYIPWFRKKKINRIASQKDYQVAVGFFEGRSGKWRTRFLSGFLEIHKRRGTFAGKTYKFIYLL